MRLVTYQLINTRELKTGIQTGKDEILDIATEARARDSALQVNTMLDIIAGGDTIMSLLREIESAPKTAPTTKIIIPPAPPAKMPQRIPTKGRAISIFVHDDFSSEATILPISLPEK